MKITPTKGRPAPAAAAAPASSKITPTRRAVVPVEALEPLGLIPSRRGPLPPKPRPRLIVFPSTVGHLDVFPEIPEGATLAQAREHLLVQLDEGGPCPCCGQFAKRYWRGLNSTMARGLMWLVKASGRDFQWIHVNVDGPSWLTSKGGTLATMAHWGLIEEKPKDEKKESRTSALWRPTVRGIRFVRNQVLVPSHVLLYNNRVEGCSEGTISIVEALGKKFDYTELMAGMLEEDALHEPALPGAAEMAVNSG